MTRTIMIRSLLFLAAALPFVGQHDAALIAAEEEPNSHLRLVDMHLAEHKYKLPAGDYVLLTQQPVGVVSTVVVHDLTKGTTTFLPGTHSQIKQKTVPLTPEQARAVRDALDKQEVLMLTRDSGFFGLDGSAFVAMIKLGNRMQRIGHWQPQAKGIALLTALYEPDRDKFEQTIFDAAAPPK